MRRRRPWLTLSPGRLERWLSWRTFPVCVVGGCGGGGRYSSVGGGVGAGVVGGVFGDVASPLFQRHCFPSRSIFNFNDLFLPGPSTYVV